MRVARGGLHTCVHICAYLHKTGHLVYTPRDTFCVCAYSHKTGHLVYTPRDTFCVLLILETGYSHYAHCTAVFFPLFA